MDFNDFVVRVRVFDGEFFKAVFREKNVIGIKDWLVPVEFQDGIGFVVQSNLMPNQMDLLALNYSQNWRYILLISTYYNTKFLINYKVKFGIEMAILEYK